MEQLSERIEHLRRERLILYQDPVCKVLLDEVKTFNQYLITTYGDYFDRPGTK
jgi:hypothetical protein